MYCAVCTTSSQNYHDYTLFDNQLIRSILIHETTNFNCLNRQQNRTNIRVRVTNFSILQQKQFIRSTKLFNGFSPNVDELRQSQNIETFFTLYQLVLVKCDLNRMSSVRPDYPFHRKALSLSYDLKIRAAKSG